MAERLIQTVAFTGVAPGATAALPHALNIKGTPVLPDFVDVSNCAFVVVDTTTTTVTVRNDGGAAGDCVVWLERKHSIPRELGGTNTPNLTPQPFVSGCGSSSTGPTRLTNTYYTPGTSRITRYLRPGGDNSNDGLTPATAWADDLDGLIQALEWLAVSSYNQMQVIDITGCSINVPTQLNLGGPNIGTTDRSFDFAGSSVAGDYSRAICQIVAEASEVLPVTVTGGSADPTSGLYTINVAQTLTVNAHRGQFLVEEGFGYVATIRSNTANTITVCTTVNPQTWVNPAIYEPGATLTTGDAGDPFSSATYLQANCDWFFSGIRFASNGGKAAAMTVTGAGPFVSFALCDFTGLDLGGPGSNAYVSLDACYIHDETWGINGASWIIRNCYARATQCVFHSSGQYADLNESVVELHTQPFGGGVSNPTFQFATTNSEFRSGTAGGVLCTFGRSRMADCVVADNTGDGIVVRDGAILSLEDVDGTGNTGEGVQIESGQVRNVGSAVTGAGGDVRVGNAGVFTWASLPQVDASTFSRAYT